MLKKPSFKIILAIFCTIILGAFICVRFAQVSASRNIDSEMSKIAAEKVKGWIDYYKADDKILLSGSPIAYIKNDKFEEIINLGPEYLPYVMKEIEKDPFAVSALWGLKDISKAKSLAIGESDGQCVQLWNSYVNELPEKFNKLKKELYEASDSELIKQKTQEIVDLGYLALPLMADENNSKMDKVLMEFFKDNFNHKYYWVLGERELQKIDTDKEKKINAIIKNYKELNKKNKKLKNMEFYKINRKYN